MKAVDLTLKDAGKIAGLLKANQIGVMLTDTIYGIVGSALNPQAVEKIYFLRKRDISKPMIILISSADDLSEFDIEITAQQRQFLQKIWPNPVSIILPCPYPEFSYLHRNKKSLAFRVPKKEILLQILKQAGPIVAPSANIENKKPAENIVQAKKYFTDKVSFYVDGGEIKSKASTIVQLYKDGAYIILREGSYKI